MVGEFDSPAELHRPFLGEQLASKNALRDEQKVLELLRGSRKMEKAQMDDASPWV